jgi:hypothetical protein
MIKPVTRLDVTTMPQEFTKKFDVTLNGVVQRLCVIADVTEGFVVKYTMGLFGAPVKRRGGVFKTQKVYGVVTITEKKPKYDITFDESANMSVKDWDALNARRDS